MSKGGQLVTDSVRDMLLGLADALDDAQTTLMESARVSDAGHGFSIPHLDFTFEVEFAEEAQADTSQPARMRLLPKTRRASDESERELRISSSISGRLASVPVQGGQPETLLDLELQDVEGAPGKRRLIVRLSNTAAERLASVPVSLQVDSDMTERLKEPRPTSKERLGLLRTQRLTTDANGRAELVIDVAPLGSRKLVVQVEARGAIGRVILTGGPS